MYVSRSSYRQIEENVLPLFPKERILIRATDEWSIDRNHSGPLREPIVSTLRSGRTSLISSYENSMTFLGVEQWFPPEYSVAHVRSYSATVTPDARELPLRLYRKDDDRLFAFLGYEIQQWMSSDP